MHLSFTTIRDLRARVTLFLIVFSIVVVPARGQEHRQFKSLTDSLVKTYNQRWDRQDVAGMYAMLTDNAVFVSPFQMRVSRDTIRSTVLAVNPQRFHDTWSEEDISSVDGDNAYSIGRMGFNIYDKGGRKTGSTEAQYLMTFFRSANRLWRVRLIIVPKES